MFGSIKHDLPIPDYHARSKYPWSRMQPGDCVVFDNPDDYPAALNAVYGYARRHKWKVTTRTLDTGLHIWRVN